MNFTSRFKHYITSKFRGGLQEDSNVRWQPVQQQSNDDEQEMPAPSPPSAMMEQVSVGSSSSCSVVSPPTTECVLVHPHYDTDSLSNPAFSDSDSEESSVSTGWKYQRRTTDGSIRSRSLIDRTKRFVRRSRDRLSLIEVGQDGRKLPFERLTDDERRPVSVLAASRGSSIRSGSSHQMACSDASLRTSGGYDENIDWSWVEQASADLLAEKTHLDPNLSAHEQDTFDTADLLQRLVPPCHSSPVTTSYRADEEDLSLVERNPIANGSGPLEAAERATGDLVDVTSCQSVLEPVSRVCTRVSSSTADAQCQTSSEHHDQTDVWPSARMRSADDVSAACSSRSSAVPPGDVMLNKQYDEAGPSRLVPVASASVPSESAVPSWLRASMRRVTHFNLDPPPVRPASAPAATAAPNVPPVPPPPPPPLAAESNDTGYISDSTDRQTSAGGRSGGGGGVTRCTNSTESGWPHGLSSVLALLGCTLGLFNVSRFAVLSVHFGANFILQFLLLTVVLGVPLISFHAALGQTLAAGPVDMWFISPIFQGIGVALVVAQALVGIYSVVGVSWMFVYFRDSFITRQDTYRWAQPFNIGYREDGSGFYNWTGVGQLEVTVPDYLAGAVLQRHSPVSADPAQAFGNLKFQLTFNLAVVWMVVFVCLSKGLRSYGKVVYLFSMVPVLGMLVLSSKLLALTPIRHGLFPHTDWGEFFFNHRSWLAAATEVSLTWNLLGAAAQQVTCENKKNRVLWRDIAVIVIITLLVLILAAFLANTCHQILTLKYSFIPSSFESANTYGFLRPMGASLPAHYATPLRSMGHASLLAGDRIFKNSYQQESGYQVVRLATELMPATLALVGADVVSPFWAVLFYFTLILLGIGQQLAVCHCVITGLLAVNKRQLASWESTITFLVCAVGFVLGLPMTTELGVFVVYFMDYCIGGGWWVLGVTLLEICAVLMLRGRPYTGEHIAQALFPRHGSCFIYWAVPLLTFTWNVIMPVALVGISISIFRAGGYRDMWVWRSTLGRSGYWPHWARHVGVIIQLMPMLCVPLTAIIQTYRYLTSGPDDILDRLSNLYRPSSAGSTSARGTSAAPSEGIGGGTSTADVNSPSISILAEDPPPKYTPPPSYSTATGARIAKLFRDSVRRSMRRLQTALEPTPVAPIQPVSPPNYTDVLVEMNHQPPNHAQNFTAQDVAAVLRSSMRRSHPYTPQTASTAPTSLTQIAPDLSLGAESAPSSLMASTEAPSKVSYLSQASDSAMIASCSNAHPSPTTTVSSLNSP